LVVLLMRLMIVS